MLNQVLFLCDNDVSQNNCTGPGENSGGGDSDPQTFAYQDLRKKIAYLILPSDVTGVSVSAISTAGLPKDGDNQYPAGMTAFQFSTDPGATKTVSIYYDLPGNPTDYTARKYKTSDQTYSDVVGAILVREDYGGKSRLKLTYSITDGGILDQDGQVNGIIIDPVGLATTNLALTGDNVWLYIFGVMSLLGVGTWFVRKVVK